MSPQRLIEGEVLSDLTDGERGGLNLLEQRLRDQADELRILRDQLSNARAEADRNMGALLSLRTQLQPLYRALQGVFGVLEILPESSGRADSAVGAVDGGIPSSTTTGTLLPRQQQIIDSWKSKVGLGPSKVLDALLLHGGLNISQLAVATGYNRSTVPQYIGDLKKTGLVHKGSDGKFYVRVP